MDVVHGYLLGSGGWGEGACVDVVAAPGGAAGDGSVAVAGAGGDDGPAVGAIAVEAGDFGVPPLLLLGAVKGA